MVDPAVVVEEDDAKSDITRSLNHNSKIVLNSLHLYLSSETFFSIKTLKKFVK